METNRSLRNSGLRLACALGTLLGAVGGSPAAVVNVNVVNNAFVPATVSINVNDQVTWNWSASDGTVSHTTTSNAGGLWDSGVHTRPFSFSHTFTSAGSFPYQCTIHAAIGMRGTVRVQGAANPLFVAGAYRGLFFVPNQVAPASSGSVSIKTTQQGRFSAALLSGRKRYSFSGQFDDAGSATKNTSARGAAPLTVALQVGPDNPDTIGGTVSDGTFTAQLAADRAVFDGRQQVAPQAGRYTLLLPGSDDSSTAPGGDGIGTLIVDRAGRIRFSGTLADGTRITQSTVLSESGNWPLYIALYGGQGSILGWLHFATIAAGNIGGDIAWFRPTLPRARFYPGGFTLNTTVSGFPYNAPAPGNNVLDLSDAVLALTGGGLTQDLSEPIRIGPRNRVTDVNGRKLNFTFTPATGLFRGVATNPDTRKRISFHGVVLQGLNVGTGYFLGASESGKATLAAP